jgi:hypothetical protein
MRRDADFSGGWGLVVDPQIGHVLSVSGWARDEHRASLQPAELEHFITSGHDRGDARRVPAMKFGIFSLHYKTAENLIFFRSFGLISAEFWTQVWRSE